MESGEQSEANGGSEAGPDQDHLGGAKRAVHLLAAGNDAVVVDAWAKYRKSTVTTFVPAGQQVLRGALDGSMADRVSGLSCYGVLMPRYHFVVYGRSVIRDPEGGLVVGDQAAIAYGAQLARELIGDSGVRCAGWSIGVENEQGHRIALIPFTTVQ